MPNRVTAGSNIDRTASAGMRPHGRTMEMRTWAPLSMSVNSAEVN